MNTNSYNDYSPVKFGTLPAAKRKTCRGPKLSYEDVASQLRARPGEWAIIRTYLNQGSAANNAAQYIRQGKSPHFMLGQYEATTRPGKSGYTDLWARYIGPVHTATTTVIAEVENQIQIIKRNLHSIDLDTAINNQK